VVFIFLTFLLLLLDFLLDVSAILALIRELADYEQEIDSVEATEDTLLSTIAFAPSRQQHQHNVEADVSKETSQPVETETISASRPAKCLVLQTPEKKIAGIALYFYNYSTWRSRPGIYLEDLVVTKSERGKGYGKRLIVELAKEVVALRGARLEWSVLKWNKPSIKFYEAIGASMMDEWVGMRVDGDRLGQLARSLD
jgi:GNAT superfamily N-acetyltransferase